MHSCAQTATTTPTAKTRRRTECVRRARALAMYYSTIFTSHSQDSRQNPGSQDAKTPDELRQYTEYISDHKDTHLLS